MAATLKKNYAFTVAIPFFYSNILFPSQWYWCFDSEGLVPFLSGSSFKQGTKKKNVPWREGEECCTNLPLDAVAADSGGTCEDVQGGGFKGVTVKLFDKSLNFCFHGEPGCKMSSSGRCPCSELGNCVSL